MIYIMRATCYCNVIYSYVRIYKDMETWKDLTK